MNLKQLLEARAKLATRIREMADKIHAEERDFNTEERSEWDKVNSEYNDLSSKIEIAQRAEEVQRQQDDLPSVPPPGRDDRSGDQPQGSDGAETAITEETRALAFQGWCRHQMGRDLEQRHEDACQAVGLNPSRQQLDIPLLDTLQFRNLQRQFRNTHPSRQHEIGLDLEQRDLSAFTGSSGGYLIPPTTFVRELETNMLAFGGMRQVSETIQTTTGEQMAWPTMDDTSNTGEQIGEAANVGSSTDPSFAQVFWNAYKFSSKLVLVPHELLEDSAFDLATLLARALGERLGRITNTKYTNGTGAGTAKGIVTAATLGKTAASATAIASDELFDLVHSIDPAYRMGASWMMHDNVLLVLRKLKDGDNRYLWQSGMQTASPDMLLNHPITINQDMADSVATTNKTLLFGQLSKYKVRRVRGMRLYRLVERYRDTDQDGFVAFVREDGNLLDAGTAPVKYLQQA